MILRSVLCVERILALRAQGVAAMMMLHLGGSGICHLVSIHMHEQRFVMNVSLNVGKQSRLGESGVAGAGCATVQVKRRYGHEVPSRNIDDAGLRNRCHFASFPMLPHSAA